MKKSRNVGISIGYVSMLFIFIILVFVSFSILSFKQASSSLKRVDSSISKLQENYTADSMGMLKKMEIDKILHDTTLNDDEKRERLEALANINIFENLIKYTIIVSDKMQLDIQLTIDREYNETTIKSWKIVLSNQEEYSQKGFNF